MPIVVMARLATTVVALPGQLTFFGDQLTKLPPERMRLLQQTLPVCDVRPLDLVPQAASRRMQALQLQLTIADLVAEVHDTHHPIAASKYYEEQKTEAKARAAR